MCPVLFSLYVNDMPSHSRQVVLAPYADKMTMSRQSALLDNFLTSYLRDLERWMREWKISSNVSKSTAMLFAKAYRHFPTPRPVHLFGEQIHWVETAPFLGVTLDTQLTWSTHVDQVRKEAAQRIAMLALLLNRSSGLSIITGVCCISSSSDL